MLKQLLLTTLSMAAFLAIASCQPGTSPISTDSPTTNPISSPACFEPADLNPISFTPDSKSLVIRASSGVQVFDLKTMEQEKFLQAPRTILGAALSPDGQTAAWSFEDHSIQLIQVSDGQLIETLKGHTDIILKLRFSPDSERLFSASHDGTVRIWDRKGALLQVIETGGEVLGMGVSPDGNEIATVLFDGPVELWDVKSAQKISTLGGTGGFDTSDAVFSPDGKYLATDLASGIFLWDLSSGKSLWDKPRNGLAITFSPDAKYLAYALAEDKSKVILSSPDGTRGVHSWSGMQGTVWELIFSPDSSLLAGSDGAEIRIWNVQDGSLLYIGKSSCS